MPFGTPAEIYFLELQQTEDEEVKEILLDGLREITGQDFGRDLSMWSEWIRKDAEEFYDRGHDELADFIDIETQAALVRDSDQDVVLEMLEESWPQNPSASIPATQSL